MSKNLATITTGAALRLGDSANNIWTLAELQRYAKDGLVRLCAETKCYWKQAYLNDNASIGDSALPTDYLYLDRAVWNAIPLEIVSIHRLREIDYRHETLEGDVRVLGLDGMTAWKYRVPNTTNSNAQPASYAPETSTETNTRIEYFAKIPDPTTLIDLPNSYIRLARHFVLWKAYERDGPGQSLKLAEHYRLRWVDGIEAVKRSIQSMQQRPGMLGEGRVSTGRRPARPKLPYSYGRIVR